MIQNMNQHIEKYLPVIGGLLGSIVFLLFYGYKILDPSFIGWTMKGDAATHFLGWHFFRSEPWSLPLGLINSYQYPQGTSLIFTDSIPLLAIPLKLISSLLPPIFQYHGLWLLLCYLLQGYFAVLLIKQITDKPFPILLGVLFFLLSPVIVQRSLEHEALSAHWIILASLYLYFQKYNLNIKIKWVILLVIAVMVHFYLFIMAFIIFSGFLLKVIMENYKNNFISIIIFSIITIAIVLISMLLLGYFVIDIGNSTAGGFGHYSMNLLSLINSNGISIFLKSFPLATTGQYEGFNYLGLGLILLLLISIYELSRQKNFFITKIHLPLIFIALILLAISISNKITFSNIVLVEFELPYFIEKLLGVVRSSGRMFWPVTYMLMLTAIAIIIKYNSSRRAILFLFIFVWLQLLDLSVSYQNILNIDKASWVSPLQSNLWNKLMKKSEHIVFVPAMRYGDEYVPFALLAANHAKTINVGYTARTNNKDREIYRQNLLREFKEGKLKKNTLYVIKENEYFYLPRSSSNFTSRILDRYAIIIPKTSEIKESELTPLPISIQIDDHKHSLYSLIKKYMIPDYAILLSIRDEGTANMPKDFLKLMKSIGSNIDELQFRGSYVSMIINGKLEIEKINNNKQVGFEYKLFNHKINVVSSGIMFGNTSIINIDNIPLSTNRRGLNIVILNLNENKVKRYNFDTYQYNDSIMASE